MVFKKRVENNGEVDPNISKKGRPPKDKEKIVTRRSAQDQELLGLARKLKPTLAPAIKEGLRILNDSEAKDADKLKASALFLKTFQDVLSDLYREEPSAPVEATDKTAIQAKSEIQEIQPKVDNRPIFSLRVINNPDEFKLNSAEDKEE